MDPTTMIMTALATGTATSLQETTSTAIKDAYNGFKALLLQKFAHEPKAQTALINFEKDPDTYEKPFKKTISTTHLDQDEEVIAAAQHLITLIHPQQAGMGKFTIQNTGTMQGTNFGDHNTNTNTFNAPPSP